MGVPIPDHMSSDTDMEKAIAELEECFADANRNRSKEDPDWNCKRWDGFLEGIGSAIYRLEMATNGRIEPVGSYSGGLSSDELDRLFLKMKKTLKKL